MTNQDQFNYLVLVWKIISLFVCIDSERPDCKRSEFKYF